MNSEASGFFFGNFSRLFGLAKIFAVLATLQLFASKRLDIILFYDLSRRLFICAAGDASWALKFECAYKPISRVDITQDLPQ
jgi:hypothetical protein